MKHFNSLKTMIESNINLFKSYSPGILITIKSVFRWINRYRVAATLILVSTFYTCIDPYTPNLKGYDSLLVVDALITDENHSYTVKLSKTIQDQNTFPEIVSDAIVTINDESDNTIYRLNYYNGFYKTDSLTFRGVVGRSYTLHITTREGTEYESDKCTMQPVPDIESVYYSKDQEFINNGTEMEDGIRIYLNSKGGVDKGFLRWAFVETWKFSVPNPKRYDYLGGGNVALLSDIKKYCWKTKLSDQIIIPSAYSKNTGTIQRQPIFFIAPAKSDRLMLGYSILVKQYSISERENEFWTNLKKVNESGSDIFASQPFSVASNIRNINNPKEKVLGFFQVSAEKEKRLFIPFNVIADNQLPFYHNYGCARIEKAPSEYGTELGPKVTFDDLYRIFCIDADFYFIEPLYDQAGLLEKLVFSRSECANETGLLG
jgi:hypothetical protein